MMMQLLTRLAFAKGIFLASLSPSPSAFAVDVDDEDSRPRPMTESAHVALATMPHKRPNRGVSVTSDYQDNPTVFGKILRGEIGCHEFDETPHVLAFEDIHPRADLHALVIPKRYIPTVFDLTPDDLGLLEEMRDTALRVLQVHQPDAYRTGDYRLVFHVPPYNSVNHLHLHVLAPASTMRWFYAWIKYNPRTRWCTDWAAVVQRLQRGHPAVPYRRPARLDRLSSCPGSSTSTTTTTPTTTASSNASTSYEDDVDAV
jgi:diadenosine tetraphosphate (Ap4A) HIT family hydrolase